MAKKTFKIGECCKGGIIKVVTTEKKISINVHDMYLDNKIIATHDEQITDYDKNINCDALERRISNFLHDMTTAYYAGKVMNWMKDKTGIKFFWC